MNSPLYVSYFLFLSFILFFFYPLLLSFSLSFFMSLHLGHMHSAIRGQSKLFLCNIRPRTLKSSSVLFISPQLFPQINWCPTSNLWSSINISAPFSKLWVFFAPAFASESHIGCCISKSASGSNISDFHTSKKIRM